MEVNVITPVTEICIPTCIFDNTKVKLNAALTLFSYSNENAVVDLIKIIVEQKMLI